MLQSSSGQKWRSVNNSYSRALLRIHIVFEVKRIVPPNLYLLKLNVYHWYLEGWNGKKKFFFSQQKGKMLTTCAPWNLLPIYHSSIVGPFSQVFVAWCICWTRTVSGYFSLTLTYLKLIYWFLATDFEELMPEELFSCTVSDFAKTFWEM